MSERRYDEDEVARIFEEATRRALATGPGSRKGLPASEGLTLAELQEIGAEVGLPADAVVAGAAVVEAGASPIDVTGTTLGMPHGVAGAIPLPRRPDDREWGILVGRLRHTFAAHGTVESDGTTRSWRNGNLQFRVEPTASGTVLRMRTHKSDGRALPAVGGAMASFGAILGGLLAMGGDLRAAGVLGSMLLAVGILVFGVGALTVPAWARTRKKQMEEVAAFTVQLLSRPPKEPEP